VTIIEINKTFREVHSNGVDLYFPNALFTVFITSRS